MFYTPSERVSIGRRVFAHEITKEAAAKEYSVSVQSIVNNQCASCAYFIVNKEVYRRKGLQVRTFLH